MDDKFLQAAIDDRIGSTVRRDPDGIERRVDRSPYATVHEVVDEDFSFVSAELDERIARGRKAILRDNQIAKALRAYVNDHLQDQTVLEPGEAAIFADLKTILVG